MYENIKQVGLPQWSEADQTLAKAVQRELKVPERGLATQIRAAARAGEAIPEEDKRGGGSDDIGDVSWNVPTVTLRYPSNIPNLPGHNWVERDHHGDADRAQGRDGGREGAGDDDGRSADAPRAREGGLGLLQQRPDQDDEVQPLIRPEDKPAIWLNKKTMAKYRPEMKKYYYDPTKYKTYLDQLGIKYPTVR